MMTMTMEYPVDDVNKVLISGKVGTVPQLQRLSNYTHLCYFSLSTIERWTSPDGQPMERNNWFKIEVLGKNAEYAAETVKKGDYYLIDGYLRYEKYEEKRSIVKIRAYSLRLLNKGAQPQEKQFNDNNETFNGLDRPTESHRKDDRQP